MRRRLTILIGWVIGISIILFIAAWVFLSTSPFAELRRSFVADVLSDQIGQTLIINEDVAVNLGPVSRLYVSGVEIPSETIDNVNLAQLEALELDVDLVALWNGAISLDNLIVDGLQVNILAMEDGSRSWIPVQSPASDEASTETTDTDSEENNSGILDFLNDKTVSFSNIGLLVSNERSGFSFDFDLQHLELDQLDAGKRVALNSEGLLNGEPFSIEGDFPRKNPFKITTLIGPTTLNIDGVPAPKESGGGFSGALHLDTGEFGEILDILKLDRVLEGNGRLSADIEHQVGTLKITNFQTDIQLSEGELFEASGSVDNLLDATGFDLAINARLFPQGQPPARAHKLSELELTGITTQIISRDDRIKFENLTFETNAFEQDLSEVGPISIGRIVRSEAGQLSMRDISVQLGPLDAPYVVAKGDLQDVLQLKGVEFDGTLAASATLLLPDFDTDDAAAFGKAKADFAVTDASGNLSLTKLSAYTEDTDLWSLDTKMQVDDVADLEGLEFELNLAVPDGKSFLTALNLTPVDVGNMAFSISGERQGEEFNLSTSLTAERSQLLAEFESRLIDGAPLVRGLISSDLLRIDDLKNAVASAAEISSLAKEQSGAGKAKKIEAPLVLPKEESEPLDDKIEEALVIEIEDEPLVLGVGPDEATKPTDLLNAVETFTKLDMEVGIDIRKIEGQAGVSNVKSNFVVKDAQGQFGPLEFGYGGGSFSVSAAMDFLNSPQFVTVSGSTGGWDLATILKTAGVSLDAHGKLRASFNVTGNRKSAKTFIDSMAGAVTISMSKGTVASSLLELAGLGVFPWLFSAELNQGYTNIVCAVAPLNIKSGRVSTGSTVIETSRVQMVIGGNLDWKNETIALRAEPRPVGRPLARSAWPIEVTGSLKSPKLNLTPGGNRRAKSEVPAGVKKTLKLGLFSSKKKEPESKDRTASASSQRTPCKPDIGQIQ
ncbi:MAG: AsmA family protein [Paracoccaceae bacterium]